MHHVTFVRLIVVTLCMLTTADAQTLPVGEFSDLFATSLTGNGQLRWSGNELKVDSLGLDPSKVRVGAPDGRAAFSWNRRRFDGNHEELAYFISWASAGDGGNLQLRIRPPSSGGQTEPVFTITTETPDGLPKVIFHVPVEWASVPTPPEDPPPPPPPDGPPPPTPGIDVPYALVTQTNLIGTVAALQGMGDGLWLTLENSSSGDAKCEADILISGSPSTLAVELRRTGSGDPAPYVYISVNDERVRSLQFTQAADVVYASDIQVTGTARIKVQVSGQNGGSVNIGGIAVSR